MKKFIQFLLYVSPILCFPQSNFVDSLLQTIDGKEDDIKITVLLDYCKGFSMSDPGLSLELAGKAHELAQKSGNPLLISNTLNGLSILNYYLGKNSIALELLLESIDYVKKAQENHPDSTLMLKRLMGMYNNAGNIYQAMGELEKSLDMHLRTLRLTDTLMQRQPENAEIIPARIRAMNNAAIVYWNLGRIDKASTLLQDALDLGRRYDQPEIIIFTLNNIGLVQIEQGQYQQAIDTYQEALEIGKKINDSIGIGGNYNNLGLIMEKTGNNRKALAYYLSSLQISERLGYSIGISNTCSNLGRVYGELNQPDSALFYTYRGIDEAKASRNKTYLLKNYETLFRVYEKLGQYDKALEFHMKYITVKDSIFNEEKSGQIAEMETKYETEKKEKENEILRKNAEIQQRTNLVLIIGVSALFIVSILLYYLFRLKNNTLKQKTKIYEQQSQMQEIEKARLEDQLFAELQINKLQNEKLEHKNRELSSHILHAINKNEAMTNILNELKIIKHGDKNDFNQCFIKVSHLVKENISLDKEWEQFKLHFDEVNPGFFYNLQQKYPELSQNDLKLCAYYRINLGTKEIARMLNTTPSAVQKSRHRLRKKMDIFSETELPDFMSRF